MNNAKILLRSMKKQKAYSFINIAGLSVGMACCILILLFVQDDLSYDRYHEYADRIYRIATDAEIGVVSRRWALAPPPMGPALVSELDEVQAFTRIINGQMFSEEGLAVEYENKKFEEARMIFADTSFFDIYSFEFIAGNKASALRDPQSVILSSSASERLFGDKNPVGEVLTIRDLFSARVAGVIKDVPPNSHFSFDYVLPVQSLTGHLPPNFLSMWTTPNNHTYILLSGDASPEAVQAKMKLIFEENAGELLQQSGVTFSLYLQPLVDIHLNSHLEYEMEANSEQMYIYIFLTIAVFILVIACINFMNLSTARSSKRAREIGVRKVFGARRKELARQFMEESFVMVFLGFGLSLLIVWLVLPLFGQLAGREYAWTVLFQKEILVVLFVMIFFTGLFAGSYPAFILSAFKPITALKGESRASGSAALRKLLVVVQFSISIFLIASTMIISGQVTYMKNKDLGFAKEQIVVVPVRNVSAAVDSAGAVLKWQTLKTELQRIPHVANVSFSSTIPGREYGSPIFIPEGSDQNETHAMDVIFSDFDFIKTYGISLISGRDLSESFATDAATAFLLNESAVQKFGWTPIQAIGKELKMFAVDLAKTGRVVGVVKNFHNKSVKEHIAPVVLTVPPSLQGYAAHNYASVKIGTAAILETLTLLRQKWQEIEPDKEFAYFFLDEDFRRKYASEEKVQKIFTIFAVLAVVIACLGLFGLASFAAEQRKKEIGVRKVLGASVSKVALQLSGDFSKWVLLSNVLALPVTYYVISNFWLSHFAFRFELSSATFIIAGGISVFIALFTVGYQAVKAAYSNPATALREN